MPVYRRSYRSYEGEYVHSFRWWLVFRQELRVLGKFWGFFILMLVAQLHTLLRLLQIVAYDVIMQDPNNVLTPLLSQVQAIVVNQRAFYDYVQLQAPMVLLLLLYAGAGMICNDMRNNLLDVYFSKPISWWDYVVGKVMALSFLGFSITGLPAIFLVLMHNILRPSTALLQESWWWPGSLMLFSAIIVLPCALSILACSSVLRSQGFAAITIFMTIITVSALGGLLANLLRDRDYILLSFPATLYRLGTELFDVPKLHFDTSVGMSIAYVAFVCLLSFGVLALKVRRAEVAS
jgi:ABC-type transport system involved in multi-copper enzyme maturation permease subunit